MLLDKVDDTLTIFWHLFLAPETDASCLVPETMTHLADNLANDTGRKKTEMYADFVNFENDDVIAAVLAFRLLKKNLKKKQLTGKLNTAPFLFANKQCCHLLRLTNHSSAFRLVVGLKLNMFYLAPVSVTRKIWHQKSMTD